MVTDVLRRKHDGVKYWQWLCEEGGSPKYVCPKNGYLKDRGGLVQKLQGRSALSAAVVVARTKVPPAEAPAATARADEPPDESPATTEELGASVGGEGNAIINFWWLCNYDMSKLRKQLEIPIKANSHYSTRIVREEGVLSWRLRG